MNHTRTILPTYDPFTPPGQYPADVRAQSVGKYSLIALSPVVAAVKGLGDDPPAVDPAAAAASPALVAPAAMTPAGVAWTAMFLGVVAALSYTAGTAMSPTRQESSTWGWIGVPVGLFTGVVGLGVMGAVANSKKG